MRFEQLPRKPGCRLGRDTLNQMFDFMRADPHPATRLASELSGKQLEPHSQNGLVRISAASWLP